MQRIPESSCVRKEIVDIDFLLTSRNADRKIMQSIRIMGRPEHENKEVEPVEPVQMNICQGNTYRKDLTWLHFNNKPAGSKEATSEGSTVLHIHFCSLSNNSKKQLGIPAQTWLFHAWSYDRFTEIQSNLRRKKLHRTNQGSNLEEKINPSILKEYFFSRTEPFIFTLIAPVLLEQSNKTSWFFPALKSTSHFLPQSTVSHRSASSSETNSSCCHRSDVWSHLEQRVVSSA